MRAPSLVNICLACSVGRSRCSPIAKSAWGHSDGESGGGRPPSPPSLPRGRGEPGEGGRDGRPGRRRRAATTRDERATVATATAKVERRITARASEEKETDGRAEERASRETRQSSVASARGERDRRECASGIYRLDGLSACTQGREGTSEDTKNKKKEANPIHSTRLGDAESECAM